MDGEQTLEEKDDIILDDNIEIKHSIMMPKPHNTELLQEKILQHRHNIAREHTRVMKYGATFCYMSIGLISLMIILQQIASLYLPDLCIDLYETFSKNNLSDFELNKLYAGILQTLSDTKDLIATLITGILPILSGIFVYDRMKDRE